jgi:hypothetical protein
MYMSDDRLFALLEKQKTKKLMSIAKHFKILAVPAKPVSYRQNLIDAIWFEIDDNIQRDKLIDLLTKRRKKAKHRAKKQAKKRKTRHAKKRRIKRAKKKHVKKKIVKKKRKHKSAKHKLKRKSRKTRHRKK